MDELNKLRTIAIETIYADGHPEGLTGKALAEWAVGAGWDALLKTLSEAAGSFDEQALKNHDRLHFQYENGVGEHGIRYRCLLEGARWQFDQMSARVGLTEHWLNEYRKSIKDYEARLSEVCKCKSK